MSAHSFCLAPRIRPASHCSTWPGHPCSQPTSLRHRSLRGQNMGQTFQATRGQTEPRCVDSAAGAGRGTRRTVRNRRTAGRSSLPTRSGRVEETRERSPAGGTHHIQLMFMRQLPPRLSFPDTVEECNKTCAVTVRTAYGRGPRPCWRDSNVGSCNERARVQVRALAGLIVLEGLPPPHG